MPNFADTLAPRLIVEAATCPHCREPVLNCDRNGRSFSADRFDLSAIPERLDFIQHRCPGYVASQPPGFAAALGESWGTSR